MSPTIPRKSASCWTDSEMFVSRCTTVTTRTCSFWNLARSGLTHAVLPIVGGSFTSHSYDARLPNPRSWVSEA